MRFITLVAITYFLISCDNQRLYETNTELPDKFWVADSVLAFDFEVTDSNIAYNLYINIRNTVSYPFENIYVTYYLKDSLQNELGTDLVNYDLFDPKTGQPYGDGLGDIFDHQFLLLKNHRFDLAGVYTFELQQYMRMDTLPEILAAGIRVEKALTTNEGN